MKIPFTIPEIVLQTYSQELNEEELNLQYQGRVLRSEDPSWDDDLKPSLAEQCLGSIIDDYEFYVHLTAEFNKIGTAKHDAARAAWENDLAYYRKRKASFDRKKLAMELDAARKAARNDAYDDDDNVDDDDEGLGKKILIEPVAVPEEFPDYVPIPPVLDRLSYVDRITVIEELDIDNIPLDIAVVTIPDEHYWERAATARWPRCHIADHDGDWRRLYMEKHIWQCIETFHPFESDLSKLLEEIKLVGDEVSMLCLYNLIPICFGVPLKPSLHKPFDADVVIGEYNEVDEGLGESSLENESLQSEQVQPDGDEEDEGDEKDDGKEAVSRDDNSHLDFCLVLPLFTNLVKFSLIYEMQETGLDWEDRLFEFTDQDAQNLANALSLAKTIEIFELNRSHVTGEQCKVLVRDGLIKMPQLQVLNLSYNKVGDDGAKALARLITDTTSRIRHTLRSLSLCRNQIRNKGAKALAYGLTKNNHLTHLDLRLNFIGDPGGRDFGHALAKNSSLLYLNLAGNRLGEAACNILGKMLYHNEVLKELDLSSNSLGKKGGENIAQGMRGNKTLIKLDLRLTNIGFDFEYDVMTHLKKNRARAGFSNVERDDNYLPEDKSDIFYSEDEDEEYEDEWNENEEEIVMIVQPPSLDGPGQPIHSDSEEEKNRV